MVPAILARTRRIALDKVGMAAMTTRAMSTTSSTYSIISWPSSLRNQSRTRRYGSSMSLSRWRDMRQCPWALCTGLANVAGPSGPVVPRWPAPRRAGLPWPRMTTATCKIGPLIYAQYAAPMRCFSCSLAPLGKQEVRELLRSWLELEPQVRAGLICARLPTAARNIYLSGSNARRGGLVERRAPVEWRTECGS